MTKLLLTVGQFAEKYPAFTQGSLRRIIFNSDKNGFDQVIHRLGRKVLIDEIAFFEWFSRQAHSVKKGARS